MDVDGARPGQPRPAFKAMLTPNRSLPPRGFLALMMAVSIVSFVVGVAFALVGAWPVLGFLGLDVLAIYIAFRLNYRDGRAYELVEVTGDAVTVTQVSAKGASQRHDFNPFFVRIKLEEAPDGSATLVLRSRERRLVIARFLSDPERREFAGALGRALVEARGGPRI
ncbi:MAG: DUF2244 domain-containing protein [Myxococcales bacterium]|nr:DUF2244 domain-containing protein [Myxococcales bacterium]